jgi:hypothetical protein
MSWRHRLGVYYGLAEDEALAAEMKQERVRLWRVVAFAVGFAVLVGVPALGLVALLGRDFTAREIARTALGVSAVIVLAVWVTAAVARLRRRDG